MAWSKRLKSLIFFLLPPAFWLGVWQLAAFWVDRRVEGRGNELLLPYPASVLAALLPSEMTEAEILPILEAVITELGASTKKDMGRVMKEMQTRTEGRAPGKILSKLVGSRLN